MASKKKVSASKPSKPKAEPEAKPTTKPKEGNTQENSTDWG